MRERLSRKAHTKSFSPRVAFMRRCGINKSGLSGHAPWLPELPRRPSERCEGRTWELRYPRKTTLVMRRPALSQGSHMATTRNTKRTGPGLHPHRPLDKTRRPRQTPSLPTAAERLRSLDHTDYWALNNLTLNSSRNKDFTTCEHVFSRKGATSTCDTIYSLHGHGMRHRNGVQRCLRFCFFVFGMGGGWVTATTPP